MITRTDRDNHLLNTMVANDALKVGDLAEVGHQRLQLCIRTVGLDESDEVEPWILAKGLHFFNGAQRALISSNDQGGEAPLTAVDLLDRSRRDDHAPEQRERTVTQEQHTQRGVILTVRHNRIVQQQCKKQHQYPYQRRQGDLPQLQNPVTLHGLQVHARQGMQHQPEQRNQRQP